MDSVSQAALGAAVCAACVPARHRRKALLLGAALGTLPDLDVLIDYGDAVRNMTYRRGFSHSLFVLLPFGALLWALPLLAAVCIGLISGEARHAGVALAVGLGLSTAYLGWGLAAQQRVDAIAAASLAGTPHADAPRLVVATPFNTLLWRVVVLTPEGYLEGQYSLVADRGPVRFEAHAFDRGLLAEAGDVWTVQRLLWFSQGFLRADEVEGELRLSDLRMGQYPVFFFAHAVARREPGGWRAVEPRAIPQPREQEGQLFALWQRIWQGDPVPAASAGAALAAEAGGVPEAAQAAEAKGGRSPAASASK